jgi:hypothetical protein
MKAILLVICMGWFLHGFAQQNYFVLIQSEKSQPFYARVLDKNYSSSSIGHLIISNLKDSAYTVVIGFPQNQFPEQEFLIRISKKDRGYQLKNMGDKGWALFDTRTMELISPVKAEKTTSGGTAVYIKKTDGFARLMAGVVNDTAVLYAMVEEAKPKVVEVVAKNDEVKKDEVKKEEIKKEEPVVAKKEEVKKEEPVVAKKEETQNVKKPENPTVPDVKVTSDTATINNNPVVSKETVSKQVKTDTVVIKPDTVAIKPVQEVAVKEPEQKPAAPVIKVINQFSTDTGYHMVIVDELKDSIRIFIPADKEDEVAKKQPAPFTKNTSDVVAPDEKKDASADTLSKQPRMVMINSDCRNFAASNDVDKLRVKLLQEKDAAGRIAAAKKIFRTKCFNAQQVKSLTEFFPYDDQKYLFLEAAYPFVSDTANFKELVSLFSDPVYNQRFRKLVRLD